MNICVDIVKFLESLPNKGKIMGLDLSPRKIGLAISDTHRKIALPFAVLFNGNVQYIEARKTFKLRPSDIHIIHRIKEESIVGWVVGWPVGLTPKQNIGRLIETREMLDNLSQTFGTMPNVLLHDERFSTVMARSMYSEKYGLAALRTAHRTKTPLDDFAAACVLQEVINFTGTLTHKDSS